MDLTFFSGQVVAIDTLNVDSRGVTVPLVFVKSFLDGTVLPIEWLPIGADQKMPSAGNEVLYYRMGTYNTRIVSYYGNNDSHIRKGEFGLNEGEVVIQSDSGLGYLKLGEDGSTELVTGDAVSSLEGSNDGWAMKAPNITMETFGRCSIVLKEDGSISIQRTSGTGEVRAKIELDINDNVSVEAKGNLVLKGKQILLDGEVFFGLGASDQLKRSKFGDIVTAGPFGTHPLDFLSGAPIQGVSSVKAGA
jgi:hypothetical protein